MQKPKIALYGGPDLSPNLLMNEIQESAHAEFDVLRLPGHGEDHSSIVARTDEIRGSVALLIGFSHDYGPEHLHTGPQIALTKELLSQKNAPRMIYVEDMPGNATEFDAVREIAPHATVLTAAPGNEDKVKAFGWGDLLHVTLPPHWKNWIQKIRSGQMLRREKKLRIRPHGSEEEGADMGGRPIIYVSGYKNPAVEALVLQSVRAALDTALGAENYVLHFRRDSREDKLPIPDLDRLKAQRESALAGTLELGNPELDSNEALTGAADVNITHPGSSLVPTIVGALRLNVIAMMAYVQEQNTNYDYRGNAERGTLVVERATDAGDAVLNLLSKQGADDLRRKQSQHVKELPEDWNGGRMIVEWLKSWIQ